VRADKFFKGEAQSGRGRTAIHYGAGGKPEFVAGLFCK